MQLRILKPKESATAAKLTVHKTGKLGLSKGAAELMETDNHRFVKFGYDDADQLHIVACKTADEETYAVGKAGDYYYIPAKGLLDEMKIDYTAPETTIFDLRRTVENGIFKLTSRIIKK